MTPISPAIFSFTTSGSQPTPELIANRDGRIGFEVRPTGAAITGLKIQIRRHPDSTVYEDRLTDADITAASTNPDVIGVSATPPYQTADGGWSWADLNLGLVYSIRFVPTSTATSIIIRGVH